MKKLKSNICFFICILEILIIINEGLYFNSSFRILVKVEDAENEKNINVVEFFIEKYSILYNSLHKYNNLN